MFKKRVITVARERGGLSPQMEEEDHDPNELYQTTSAELIEEAFLLRSLTHNLEDLDETIKELGGVEAEGWGSMIMMDEDILEDTDSNMMFKRQGGIIRMPDHDDSILQSRYLSFLEDQFRNDTWFELLSEED